MSDLDAYVHIQPSENFYLQSEVLSSSYAPADRYQNHKYANYVTKRESCLSKKATSWEWMRQ